MDAFGPEWHGRDLIDVLGMQPGPAVGRVLNALLEAVLAEPSLNERGKLLERARELRDEVDT